MGGRNKQLYGVRQRRNSVQCVKSGELLGGKSEHRKLDNRRVRRNKEYADKQEQVRTGQCSNKNNKRNRRVRVLR